MTDEAVSAESISAAEPDFESATPEPPEPKAPRSARDDVADALKSLNISDDDEEDIPEPVKADAEPDDPPEESGPKRGPDGKFVKAEGAEESEAKPKEPEAKAPEKAEPEKAKPEPKDEYSDPPARFHDAAKGAWKDAPKEVRAEVKRALGDMEKGLAEHQQRWEPLKDWDALAKKHGTTIQEALQRYTAFERGIREDPVAGMRQAFTDLGLDFNEVIAKATGEPQDQTLARYETQINRLTQHIKQLETQQQQALRSIQNEQETRTVREVEAFAAEHPRFDELSADIAYFLRPGPGGEPARADTLSEAYELAERLNPVPVPASPPAAQTREQPTPTPPAAQTRTEASLSVAGAPGPGSDPARRRPPASARDAVNQAIASLGL